MRFGMGLSSMHVSRPERRDRLLLICALAIAVLSLLGAAGEALGYDRCLKANTVKRRTHSLFRQGLMLYHHLPNWPEDRIRPLMEKFRKPAHGTSGVSRGFRRNLTASEIRESMSRTTRRPTNTDHAAKRRRHPEAPETRSQSTPANTDQPPGMTDRANYNVQRSTPTKVARRRPPRKLERRSTPTRDRPATETATRSSQTEGWAGAHPLAHPPEIADRSAHVEAPGSPITPASRRHTANAKTTLRPGPRHDNRSEMDHRDRRSSPHHPGTICSSSTSPGRSD